jgi:hypothetical protein
VAFAVLAEHFASGKYPESECEHLGIDTSEHNEGSCAIGSHRLVVVNEDSTLVLDSLEAKLEGVRERSTVRGPAGHQTADGKFFTFDLAITNRTKSPAKFRKGQAVLLVGDTYGEDGEIDAKGYEPHSFLALARPIPPGGTESATVTFAVPAEEAAALREEGNLDLENFGTRGDPANPEAIFYTAEHGVIRTYQ